MRSEKTLNREKFSDSKLCFISLHCSFSTSVASDFREGKVSSLLIFHAQLRLVSSSPTKQAKE